MEIECGKQLDRQTVRLAGSQIQAQENMSLLAWLGRRGDESPSAIN